MEFDERTRDLLEQLVPPVDQAPNRWADVLTRSRRPRRWRLLVPHGRGGVVAIAAAMVLSAAVAQGAGLPRFAVSYFTDSSNSVPESVRAWFLRQVPTIRADQIQLLARFTTSKGTFAYYAAPRHGGGFCNMVDSHPPSGSCLLPVPYRGITYRVESEGDSDTNAWVISGLMPAQATRVAVGYADGTTEAAHTGNGWFVTVVNPGHFRRGHQPTAITVFGTGGIVIRSLPLPTQCFVSPASLAASGSSDLFVLGGHCPSPPAPPVTAPAPPPIVPAPAVPGTVRFGILHDLTRAPDGNGYIATIDLAQFLVASTAEQQICRADGGSPQACKPTPKANQLCVAAHTADPSTGRCWNDYFVANPGTALIKIPVAPDAALILHPQLPQMLTTGSLATYARVIHRHGTVPYPYNAVRPDYGHFWLVIHHGTIEQLSQQFTP